MRLVHGREELLLLDALEDPLERSKVRAFGPNDTSRVAQTPTVVRAEGLIVSVVAFRCWGYPADALGHLGQAFLWTLGLLPYADQSKVELVLQDHDRLVDANDSTSLPTTSDIVREKKTRAMARWCEERGFRTTITERRFEADFRVGGAEPSVTLCGVDNASARAALEAPGFGRVIEAGLGGGTREYLDFQVHTFPAKRARKSVGAERRRKGRQRAFWRDRPTRRWSRRGSISVA